MFLLFKLIKPFVLLVVLVAVYLLAPAIGTPSPTALHARVMTETGGMSFGSDTCRKRGTVTWRCSIWPPSGSAAASYSVRLDGRCFTARRITAPGSDGQPLAARASGCVKLRDQLPGAHALAGIG